MTLEQLRIFVAVAEREHVSDAARALHLTQSAASAAIAALEERYAARLFHRIGRRIELTDAGRQFLVEARAVLRRARDAETVLSDLAGLKRGTLAIAASQTVGNYWVPPLLHRFRANHPGIAVSLTIGNTEAVRRLVHSGEVDIGFVEGTFDDPALSVMAVADDELVLVLGPAMAPSRRRSLTADDLKVLPWVLREQGSGTRAIAEAALRRHGLSTTELKIELVLPTNEAVRAAVLAGAGATILSRLVVAVPLKAGTLVSPRFAVPRRQFFALRHKERYQTEAVRAFLALAGRSTS